MSDPKRVNLSTLSSSTSAFCGNNGVPGFTAATSAISMRFGGGQDKATGSGAEPLIERKGIVKTIRLDLELFQTDSSSYPEFNYSKILHLQKKKLKKLKQANNGVSDPFGDNDDDVARIAKEFEKKYGSGYVNGRRKCKKDDHCDIGMGYDESDSFIDNTEAYDEVIPEEVETIEGGFYINCGALEFKQLHSEPAKTKTDEIIKMPNRIRKRVLSSSSSSEDDDDEDEDDESDDDDDDDDEDEEDSAEENTLESKGNKKLNGPADKRPKPSGGVVKNLNENSDSRKKDKQGSLTISSTSNSPKPSVEEFGSDSDKERLQKKNAKTSTVTTVKDLLKTKRDNFLKMRTDSDSKVSNGELKGSSKSSNEETSTESDDSHESNASKLKDQPANVAVDENSEKIRIVDTKLPKLDTELMELIQEFRDSSKSKNLFGKKFQFDEKLTEVFLKMDDLLECIHKSQKSQVFAHLEYHLMLPKYFFLRKAKQLRIKEEKMKTKRALNKLRKAIIEAMPAAIENFKVEALAYSKQPISSAGIAENPVKMPKKKFIWDSNIRCLLYDVFQVRWTSYPVLGTRKETLENFITTYMREKVVDLWPEGWMTYEDIQKEIERQRNHLSKTKKDKAKQKPGGDKPLIPGISATISGSSLFAAKPGEEFPANRPSAPTSDTDSVGSGVTSNGVKRKAADIKTSKSKQQKTGSDLNNPMYNQLQVQQLTAAVSGLKADIKMQHMLSGSANLTTATLTSAQLNSITTSCTVTASSSTSSSIAAANAINFIPGQVILSKHSINQPTAMAHVIDLDKYKSTKDILHSTKQLMQLGASGAVVNIGGNIDSSSESDCVEIVEDNLPTPATVTAINKPKNIKKTSGDASNVNNNYPKPSVIFPNVMKYESNGNPTDLQKKKPDE